MTDPFRFDDGPHLMVVPVSASIPTADITDAEWLALKGRVSIVEGGYDLGDLNDVSTDGIVDGQTIIYDEETGQFAPGISGGTVARIDAGGAATARLDVGWIRLQGGLTVEAHPTVPTVTIIRPAYGAAANTIAEGNHTHALPTTTHTDIPAQGYMSSGTRSLASTSVVLPAGKSCKVEAEIKPLQIRGGDPGPCHYRLTLTIDGNQRSQPNNTNGYWAVQGVPKDAVWAHERTINGTGAAITVSASIAWVSGGGGFYTDAGDLVVTVTPNR